VQWSPWTILGGLSRRVYDTTEIALSRFLLALRFDAVSLVIVCLLTANSANPVLRGPLSLMYWAGCSTTNVCARFLNGVKLAIFDASEVEV